MIDLSGKIVMVTGGSRGIGAETVRVLVAAGGDVIVHYGTSRDRAEALADEVGRARCHLVQADLAEPGVAGGLWRAAEAWRGRIDVLVNNAGIDIPASIDADDETWAAAWRRTLQVNLFAAADLCREAVKHFRGQGGGAIINIASRAAFRGDSPTGTNLAASKAGLVALTRTIARGFGKDGVTAFVIAPGWVRTEMADAYIREHGAESVLSEIPLGELTEPRDIANMVAFLASGLARHATGSVIDVNGASYVR